MNTQPSEVQMPDNPLTRQYASMMGRSGQPQGASTVLPPAPAPVPAPSPQATPGVPQWAPPPGTVFVFIDILGRQVISSSGEEYPLTEGEAANINRFCFEVFVRALNQRASEVAAALNISLEAPNAPMSEMRGDGAGGATEEGQAG